MASSNYTITIEAKDGASAVLKRVGQQLDTASGHTSAFRESLGRIKDVALGVYLPQIGLGILGVGKAAITAAGDYQQSLNVFASVSSATADQMQQVAARARELGNDITLPGISAKDAALAMVELAKAGLSVNDTMAASKGVLSLAKAGQLDTAEAAEIASSALNAFNLEGKEATRVADLLAAAANASSADVHDMGYALQMSSASAAAVKVPVEDLTTAIAEMANNGIKGSDAGTSLKTMFMNLIPTTKRAKESMAALNLDFYDAKGNFVGMQDMVRQLQEGTKKLTDEQKAQHIENIFGSDSMRAANVLIKEGVKGYDDLHSAVTKQGAAAQLAAAQNAGFNGALDNLRSSLETVAIDAGGKFLPVLTAIVVALAGSVQPTFERVSEVVGYLAPKFAEAGRQVSEYLGPKLASLWQSISANLIPALSDLWHNIIEPLIPVLGTALVVAIGAVVDIANGVVTAFGFVYDKLKEGDPVWWGVIGVLGTLATALALSAAFNAFNAGMAIITTVTIPSVTAAFGGLAALIASPLIMPAILVGAAIAALVAVYDQAVKTRQAVDAAADAKTSALNADADLNRRASGFLSDPNATATQKSWAKRQLASDPLGPVGRAAGGPVQSGASYLVGENGPEVFTPLTSGNVGSSSGSNVVVNIYGSITNSTPEAANAFWDRIDKTQRLARVGMAGATP